MIRKFANWSAVLILAGWGLSGCSKEKTESAAPAAEKPAAVTMKEPGEPAAQETKSAPAAGGAVTVRARFDGYAPRVSVGLWQPVPTSAEVATFVLISPMEPVSTGSGLVVEGGPENLALGIPTTMQRAANGQLLDEGREYSFTLTRQGEGLWSLEVNPVP